MIARCIIILWTFILCAIPALAADTIKAAVAANFIAPFQEICVKYEARTGVKVEPTFSSSGKLYTQITNSAPFDIYLSADEDYPRKLADQGLALPPFVYAKGHVVLWTTRKDICKAKNWQTVVKREDISKLAVANPETSPYGTAAQKALKQAGLWDTILPRLVFPQDIAQAFQYASTGAVDAGFCALSSALTKEGQLGCYLAVPEAPPIVQAACVISNSPNEEKAIVFADYLHSRKAIAVIERYGYRY
jgi:molybdate transport system substrate-binding protein